MTITGNTVVTVSHASAVVVRKGLTGTWRTPLPRSVHLRDQPRGLMPINVAAYEEGSGE